MTPKRIKKNLYPNQGRIQNYFYVKGGASEFFKKQGFNTRLPFLLNTSLTLGYTRTTDPWTIFIFGQFKNNLILF